MNKSIRFIIMLAAMLFAAQTAFAAASASYYNTAMGKHDEALMTALRNIIREHRQLSYTALWEAFKTTDTDADGYIIDMYSNCRYRPDQHGGNSSAVGGGYNREHSFPKSWFNDDYPMYTDLFHLYPTDIRVNNQRSNYPFGVCKDGSRLINGNLYGKGKLGKSSYPGYSGTVFEPDDEYKGDFARTYFYMVTCYKNELPNWSGSPQLDYSTNRYKAFSTWSINMLMEWTRLDPVSEKEIKRNDAVFGIQGNRDPFIDHPELAEYIWGNMQNQIWEGSGEDIPAEITMPENGTVFDLGTTTLGVVLERTISIKGNGLTKGLVLTMENNEDFYLSRSSFSADEVNRGITVDVGFNADNECSFTNVVTMSNDEVTSTFILTATANKEGDTPPGPGPDPTLCDSITEDWENCTTGGYWTKQVQGHTWKWDFSDAGIWADNLSIGQQSCRLGKSSSSSIAMAEDVEGGSSAIGFWAGCFGSDADANLRVDYSTNQGTSWSTLGSFTFTKGALQHISMEVDVTESVRFRIVQTSGSRVNIDDITVYGRASETVLIGDVNGDGEINIADVNAVIDSILGTPNNPKCDVNGDGEINIADVNAIIDIIIAP